MATEALAVFNAPATLRSLGPFQVDSGAVVRGDVAVAEGPVIVAGRITGRLVAINADVELRPGARVDGGLLVIGGELRDAGAVPSTVVPVGGTVRVFREPLAYREVEDRLVAADSSAPTIPGGLEDWWTRWRNRDRHSGVRFLITTAKTYDRVEGLPILVGPEYRGPRPWGELRLRAQGIFRTADELRWDPENLGHDVSGDVRLGRALGVTVGGRLFDVVEPVQRWQLEGDEVGLATFLLHRDLRDYFGAHGATVSAGAFLGPDADLTLRLSQERWSSREVRDPFTILRNASPWRPNPVADAGRFHIAGATLRVDTRNVVDRPWSGWYVVADYERGTGMVDDFAALSPGVRAVDGDRVTYGRGFLDVRRYLRISPDAQVNARVVLGGWVHGDPLPAQRRLSVGGAGSLPGYDFRGVDDATNVGQCSTALIPAGAPAQCDRVALAQVEYRGDLHLHLLSGLEGMGGRGWRHAQWVAFLDSGRGWLVDRTVVPGAVLPPSLVYGTGSVPSLGGFRTDVGAGIDFGGLGLYVSRGLSEPARRTNVFVRLHERF